MNILKLYCSECLKFTGQDCGGHAFTIPQNSMLPERFGGGMITFHNTQQPYKCPVCNGTALVSFPPGVAGDAGWSGSSVGPWTCPVCDKGIIWK